MLPNLVWTLICYDREQIGFDAREVQERVRLCSGSVAAHSPTFPHRGKQILQELLLRGFGTRLHLRVILQRLQARVALPAKEGVNRGLRGAAYTTRWNGPDAETPAVGPQFLGIRDMQATLLEEINDNLERQVIEVLVVHRVKLVLLDQVHEVREFASKHSVGLEEDPTRIHEVEEIRYVSQDVVRYHEVG
jgi:hypothetical protein